MIAARPSTRPDIAAFVQRTTSASGVTEKVEDPAVIEQIAPLLRDANRPRASALGADLTTSLTAHSTIDTSASTKKRRGRAR